MTLADLIVVAGFTQLGLPGAVIQIPSRLRWRTELAALPRLSIFTARELSSGSALSRGLCAYMALFWAIKLACQAFFDMTPYWTRPWMKLGDAALTAAFASLTAIYGWAALRAA